MTFSRWWAERPTSLDLVLGAAFLGCLHVFGPSRWPLWTLVLVYAAGVAIAMWLAAMLKPWAARMDARREARAGERDG
jgi:hypothetical protein